MVVVPESDFMGQINANTQTTILLCLGALLLAIFLGMLTSRWISQPIARLSQASAAIASGDLEQRVEVTQVKERKTLAQAFNSMAEQSKILVVDDRWENRSVLVNLLESPDFQVAEAINGKDGLEKAQSWQPDLIITDLVIAKLICIMPGKTLSQPQWKKVADLERAAPNFYIDIHQYDLAKYRQPQILISIDTWILFEKVHESSHQEKLANGNLLKRIVSRVHWYIYAGICRNRCCNRQSC